MAENAKFGYVYDEGMLLHRCNYDSTMLECPQRIQIIYERLLRDGLLIDAQKIQSRKAEDWELLLNHPQELIDSLEDLNLDEECEEFCRGYELLWLCPQSVDAARIAVGSTIDMLKANINGLIGNGFAIIRPPGHHSYSNQPQAYCIFNTTAIVAKYAVEKLHLKRVLIIDIDYHCGNGTYQSLKNDNRFLFINFHAYHYGASWPFDSEYDYDSSATNHISIPLNAAMNNEFDYMAALYIIVMPLAKEFAPELVLISAGFDAAYCDQIVELDSFGQAIKAHGYGHIARLLDEHWPNKVLAILEGGYLPESYAECASQLTRGLQGASLPNIAHQKSLNTCMVETIWSGLCHHSKRWESAAVMLSRLQQQQMHNNLPIYAPPSERVFVGRKFRLIWNRIKEFRVARTRGWIQLEEATASNGSKYNDAVNRINAYIMEYDYTSQRDDLNEETFIKRMLWTPSSASEAFLLSAPATLYFYNAMEQCLNDDTSKYLIVDMATLNGVQRNISS
uniref:Histone deacetylase domain-containing protein n=1 Tax=Parascaris univalens TaxID=6257 RepID=A0A914ZLR1_PARUN